MCAVTSAYENIHAKSVEYRALQKCEFILEYKDRKSALPPPFNLIEDGFRLHFPNLSHCIQKSIVSLGQTQG